MEQCFLPATDYPYTQSHTVPTNYNLQNQNPSISCCSASYHTWAISYNTPHLPQQSRNPRDLCRCFTPSFIVLAKEPSISSYYMLPGPPLFAPCNCSIGELAMLLTDPWVCELNCGLGGGPGVATGFAALLLICCRVPELNWGLIAAC